MSSGEHEDDKGDNRRQSTRHLAVFAAHVKTEEGRARTALIKDLSVTGARILTRAKLEMGDPITLELYLTQDMQQIHAAPGKVVRVEQLEPGQSGLWSRVVGVQFDEPLAHLEEQITEVAAQQAKLHGR